MELSQYLDLFLEEARENVSILRSGLSKPGGPTPDSIKTLFRGAHSLKGMAASMEFVTTAGLAHRLEDLMDLWLKAGTAPEAELRVAVRTVDALDALVDRIQARKNDQGMEEAVAPVLRALQETLQRAGAGAPEEAEPGIPPEEPEPEPAPASTQGPAAVLRVTVDPSSPLAAARILVVKQRIAESTEILSMSPSIEEIQRGAMRTASFRVPPSPNLKELALSLKGLPEIVQVEMELEREAPPETASEAELIQSVRVRSKDLDALLADTSQLLYHLNSLEAELPPDEWRERRSWLEGHRTLLNRLFDEVLGIRLVSFETLTERLRRTARELSGRLEKPVRIELSGEDQRADRSLIERLLAPLTHLVRNALDHGMETAEDRRRKGKPEEGLLRLVIRREGESLLIELGDDGRGLDAEAVRRQAVERGVLSAAAASTLSHRQVLDLITLPAFSTRKEVSDVSGRGVGLDVVRSSVEALGGRLEMETRAGKGTTFTLVIPSAVTLTQVLTFGWDTATRFALPTSQVVRLYPLTQHPVVFMGNDRFLQAEEDLLPILTWGLGPVGREGCGIRIGTGERNPVLLTPHVYQSERVIILPLGPPLESIPEWIGGAHLSTGQVAYVLDGRALAAHFDGHKPAETK